MASLLSPAQVFLSNIKISRKLILISSLLFIPSLITISLLSFSSVNTVKAYSNAQIGVNTTIQKNKLTNELVTHRGLTSTFKNGETSVRSKILESETQVDQIFNKIAEVNKDALIDQNLGEFKRAWAKLKLDNYQGDTARYFSLHTQLITQVNNLHYLIRNQYFNGVEEIEMHNYMDLLGLELPQFADLLGQVRVTASGVSAKGSFTPDTYVQLNSQVKTTRERLLYLQQFSHVFKQTTQEKLGVHELIKACTSYFSYIQKNLINSPNVRTTSDSIFSKGSQLIEDFSQSKEKIATYVNSQIDTAQSNAKHQLIITISLFLVMSALSTYLFIAFYQDTMQNIHNIKTMSDRMAAGDLSHPLSLRTQDELSEICKAINNTCDSFSSLVKDAQASVGQVVEQTGLIDELSSQADKDMLAQQAQLDMIASAMSEMTSSAHEVEKNTSDTASSANKAEEQTKSGDQVARNAVDEISTLVNQIEQTSSAINALAEDANNIGAVTDVIRGIAEQTNLLALNAAIEAARAGEQGRGFAVVADEVRTLAQRTRESTDEIQSMISKLQDASLDVVSVTEQSRSSVETSSEQVATTLQALSNIKIAVEAINSMTTQIASAATEQAKTSESLAENVLQTHQLSTQTVGVTQQIYGASSSLKDISTRLQGKLAGFKTA